jgi:2-polyprenyl-3-methyl-5-hydroxy-6-metoxy-1,4-benzoquinol methylase
MERSSLRYAHLVQELGLNAVHREIIALVGPAQRVLDVGCSTGYLGQALQTEASRQVDGIELDPAAAQIAQRHYHRVFVGSVEDVAFVQSIAETYDAIILADVLEHLARPECVLAALAPLLKPGGYLLISVPNIAFYDIRRRLFFRGEWRYTDTGILDHTHLRFYTYHTIRDLVAAAGWWVVEQRVGVAWIPFERRLGRSFIGKRVVASPAYARFRRRLIGRYPNLFGHHSVLKVVPANDG